MNKNTNEIQDNKIENKIEIKSMTRGQIKQLRAAGLDPAFGEKDKENSAELVDWIIDHIYPELPADDLEYHILVKLATDTYTRAYRGPESIKN